METELKFALSPEARQAVERLVAGQADGTVRHHDVSTYFDTPDLRLHKAGFSLRVRQRSDRPEAVLTVKSGASTLRRGEWEWPVAGEQPDPARLAEVPGLRTVLAGHDQKLQPLFRTEVERCQRTLHPRPAVTVELAVDEGVIVAGDRRERLDELELELKQGSEDALLQVGLDLVRAAPLPLLLDSKAARGYRLVGDERPSIRKAEAVLLEADQPTDQAFGRLVDALLGEHLLANQPAVLRGDEAEGVHQMRVAVRRLRSLLVLFRPLLERCTSERFDDELRRLGDLLGRARDWDVFIDETLPQALHDGVALDVVEPLRVAARECRHAAHQQAKKAIGEPAFGRFVLALRAWSRPDAAAIVSRAGRPIAKVAPDLLDRLEEKLGKRLERSDRHDAASLHAVRKSAKKLRYGIEYFEGVFGKQAADYHKACNRLQKRLGVLNDRETAGRRAAELAASHIELTPALAALLHWAKAGRGELLRKALKADRAFRKLTPFWR